MQCRKPHRGGQAEAGLRDHLIGGGDGENEREKSEGGEEREGRRRERSKKD